MTQVSADQTSSPAGTAAPISISENGAKHALNAIAGSGKENAGVRLFVKSGGCSGYQYGMDIARDRRADDIAMENNGVPLLVDPQSALMLDGAEVDYADDLMKGGFTIYNPNAIHTCACGSSFQTADGSGTPKPCNS